MMKRIMIFIAGLMTAICMLAQNEDFCLYADGEAATLCVDANDWEGVARAASDLSEDIGRVTGTNATLQKVEKPISDGIRCGSRQAYAEDLHG